MNGTTMGGGAPFKHFEGLMKGTPRPRGRPVTGRGTPINPELAGLKHTTSLLTQPAGTPAAPQPGQVAGIATSMGGTPPTGTPPITGVPAPAVQPTPAFGGETFTGGAPQPGTTDYQQAMYNLARGQIQGQTRTEAEQMKGLMGGRGFRAGESGIADTAIGNILRGGSERLGAQSRGMGLAGMQMKYGQEQDQMNMMMRLLSGQQASQQGQWQPYWSGMTQAYT